MNNTQLKTTIKELMENPFVEYDLTPKQAEVCGLLARGYTTMEIAADLGLTKQAIDKRVRGALKIMGITQRRDLTKKFVAKLKAIVS